VNSRHVGAVAGLALAALLQGCVAGITDIQLLSDGRTIDPEQAGLHHLTTGVRLGVIDNEAGSYREEYLAETFIAKTSDAGLFKAVNYPITGQESILFEIAAKQPPPRESGLHLTKVFVCALTLLIACHTITQDYQFDLEVRARHWPGGAEIGRYRAVGQSRVTYGMASQNDAENEGMRLAATAAFNQVINEIKRDRAKYLSAPPATILP
jgi:hypothetical protein